MGERVQAMENTKIDELAEQYKALKLTYFPHWKVTPWDRRAKDATVDAYLGDLEAYLLENGWSVEERSKDARVYRYEKDPEILLKIRNHMDYFGVHTVYLIEMELIRERSMPWARVIAQGEVVFDHLRKMT